MPIKKRLVNGHRDQQNTHEVFFRETDAGLMICDESYNLAMLAMNEDGNICLVACEGISEDDGYCVDEEGELIFHSEQGWNEPDEEAALSA